MNSSYRHIGNIKGGIFLIGVFLVIGLFSYTRYLSSELREDNREVVKLYAEIIAETVKDDSNTNIDFIFENIIKKNKINENERELKSYNTNLASAEDKKCHACGQPLHDELHQEIIDFTIVRWRLTKVQ